MKRKLLKLLTGVAVGSGIVFLTAAVVLVANGHSKSEYLAAAFAGIFAAGGVAWERWLEPAGRRWLRCVLAGLVTAGLALAPAVLPILPVDTYIRYAAALGKPLITLHDEDHIHALKEVDDAALAVAETPEQVVRILNYVIEGNL